MENSRLIEVLERVRQLLLTKSSCDLGICYTFSILRDLRVITKDEYIDLNIYLMENKPTAENQYSQFTQNEYWKPNSMYWWTPIHKARVTRQLRADYLTELISNIK